MKCGQCGKGKKDGAVFGHLAKSGVRDTLCVKCRFNAIDAKYSNPEDIREDMRASGVPVNRRGGKLR